MTLPGGRFFATVDGVELHWAELGEGRPLVLLHGLHDSHRTWRRVGPTLARRRRVLMLDLPGHGLSGRPDASYELAWYARVVGHWLEALGLEDTDLAGHSFGGGVAQFLLLEQRRRIRRVALISAGGLGLEVGVGLRLASLPGVLERFGQPFMGPGTRLVMRAAGGVFDREDVAMLGWMNSRPGTARALGRTVRDVIDWRGQRRHFLDRAEHAGDLPPMALYWGDRDPIIPIAHGLAFESLVDNVELTRFAGCGHFPHQEDPGGLARALDAFLEAPSAPAARLRPRMIAVPGRRLSFGQRLLRSLGRLAAPFRRRPRPRIAEAA